MLRQLEDADDTEDPDEDQSTALLCAFAVALRLLDGEYDEEGEDGEHVEDVHHVSTEVTSRRARREASDKLDREPDDAGRLKSIISEQFTVKAQEPLSLSSLL